MVPSHRYADVFAQSFDHISIVAMEKGWISMVSDVADRNACVLFCSLRSI